MNDVKFKLSERRKKDLVDAEYRESYIEAMYEDIHSLHVDRKEFARQAFRAWFEEHGWLPGRHWNDAMKRVDALLDRLDMNESTKWGDEDATTTPEAE